MVFEDGGGGGRGWGVGGGGGMKGMQFELFTLPTNTDCNQGNGDAETAACALWAH